jgi:GNAT superfamily N-acetyltransferase
MSSDYKIKILNKVEEMLPHYELIAQLSPQLLKEEYEAWLPVMVKNNYKQVAVYENDKCVAISGYWICAKLYSGKYIEIDNFVVNKDHRGKGLGKILLDFLIEEGKKQGCRTAMLDAYAENASAHRFYYREGFFIRGFHYLKKL